MTDAMTKNLTRHGQEIQRIRANRDLSEEARRRRMAEVHNEATREHQRLLEEDRKAKEEAIASAERKVLGISYPERASAHEKAIIAMSYRDARDRAERTASSANRDNPEGLMDLLDRAEKSGDEQLAEAVFHVATLRGLRRVADAYLSARPTAQRQWEKYVAVRQEANPLNLVGRTMAPGRPAELGG